MAPLGIHALRPFLTAFVRAEAAPSVSVANSPMALAPCPEQRVVDLLAGDAGVPF